MSRADTALRAACMATALWSALPASSSAEVTAEQVRLLAATDPFAAAPAEMRIELVFSTGGSGARVQIELWRKGDSLALVRFLAPKDRGKFVLRRDRSFWFLAPGAKAPVKLAPALAPAGGAALDELLGLRPSRDYTIERAIESAGVVTFDLVAKPDVGSSPRVRWAVDRARRLPLRAEFRSAEDRVTRLIEFKSWQDASKLVPALLLAKEVARGGPPLEVEFGDIEARPVDAALFDLSDGSARRALPPPPALTPAPP